jgi:hypothetical protein
MGDERPDGNSSTRNFHIWYVRVRTMRDRHPGGWRRIVNFHISCTGVRTKADWRPDGGIWIAILALYMSASGWVYQSSLILNLERIWSWSITERRPDGLLRHPDGLLRRPDGLLRRSEGCKLEQKLLDTVEGPDEKNMSSGRMMLVCLEFRRYGTSS